MHAICCYNCETPVRSLALARLLAEPTRQRPYYERVEHVACSRYHPSVTCTMMKDEAAVKLHNLKRRRTRERANATHFSTLLDGFDDSTSLDDFEHYRGRLQENLDRLISLDDAIHNLLSDNEYEEDIQACEEYIDKTKQTIQKASRRMDNDLSASTARLSIHRSTQPTATIPVGPVSHSVKLPAIRLEPFAGNVETWSRFWEWFDPPLTTMLHFQLSTNMFSSEDTWRGSQKCCWTEKL